MNKPIHCKQSIYNHSENYQLQNEVLEMDHHLNSVFSQKNRNVIASLVASAPWCRAGRAKAFPCRPLKASSTRWLEALFDPRHKCHLLWTFSDTPSDKNPHHHSPPFILLPLTAIVTVNPTCLTPGLPAGSTNHLAPSKRARNKQHCHLLWWCWLPSPGCVRCFWLLA